MYGSRNEKKIIYSSRRCGGERPQAATSSCGDGVVVGGAAAIEAALAAAAPLLSIHSPAEPCGQPRVRQLPGVVQRCLRQRFRFPCSALLGAPFSHISAAELPYLSTRNF